MKSNEISGKSVVSISEGAKLGRIDDVLVDTEEMRIAALHITRHGEEALIPFEQVSSVSGDVVTVPSSSAAHRASAQQETADLAHLKDVSKLKVVDEAGTFLGVVRSIELDPRSGALTELQTQKGGLLGLGGESYTIPVAEVTSVGDELIVVQAPEALAETEQPFVLVKRVS